jgi:hypothetical protein
MALKQFFFVHGENSANTGVVVPYDKSVMPVLPKDGLITQWTIPDMRLTRGQFTDYLGSETPGWRICSTKMRDILDQFRVDDDSIQWLEVYVADHKGEKRSYFVLRIGRGQVLLKPEKTKFADDGSVIRPFLDSAKLSDKFIIRLPEDRSRWMISEEVKFALQQGQCTGVVFSPVRQE